MITQSQFDDGAREVVASRFVATPEFWQVLAECPFDPESFVPADPRRHALAHAIKGDTEFASDDRHGPLHGPLVERLLKTAAERVRTVELGDVFLARRVIVPRRNLTVWVYPPEAQEALAEYHSSGNLL